MEEKIVIFVGVEASENVDAVGVGYFVALAAAAGEDWGVGGACGEQVESVGVFTGCAEEQGGLFGGVLGVGDPGQQL